MPEPIKSSWADEVEEEGSGTSLPSSSVKIENGYKIITEYRFNKDDKKDKVVRTYKIEKKLLSKSVKFGASQNDGPGINPSTTIVCEEVQMQFFTSKEEAEKPEENVLDKLKLEKSIVKCRHCGGDHWSSQCPYKNTLAVKLEAEEKQASAAQLEAGKGKARQGEKYIPPGSRGESRSDAQYPTVRINNLSESTTEKDIRELVEPFGAVARVYVPMVNNACKGFAYVSFREMSKANMAVKALNGHGYDHLILQAELSQSSK